MTRPIPLNGWRSADFHWATELRRLRSGLRQGEFVQGLCVDVFDAASDLAPERLVERVKTIMSLIVERGSPAYWPSEAEWATIVPDWFRESCAPEMTSEEEERELKRRRTLSYEARLAEDRVDGAWRLSVWLSWMEPDERWWLWWDAGVSDDGTAIFGIDRLGDWYPELPGEFVWMLKACGATDVDSFAAERHTVPFPT